MQNHAQGHLSIRKKSFFIKDDLPCYGFVVLNIVSLDAPLSMVPACLYNYILH